MVRFLLTSPVLYLPCSFRNATLLTASLFTAGFLISLPLTAFSHPPLHLANSNSCFLFWMKCPLCEESIMLPPHLQLWISNLLGVMSHCPLHTSLMSPNHSDHLLMHLPCLAAYVFLGGNAWVLLTSVSLESRKVPGTE